MELKIKKIVIVCIQNFVFHAYELGTTFVKNIFYLGIIFHDVTFK